MSKIAKATIQTVCFSILALVIGAWWGLTRSGSGAGAGAGTDGPAAAAEVFAAVPSGDKTVYVVSSGDLRPAANQNCWPTQEAMERKISAAIERAGYTVIRAHKFDVAKGHGFIDSQRAGMRVFESVPPTARLIVAESVWQYSHHVLAGLRHHNGPILTLANFEGKWPGLVGMLNLNGGLTKAAVAYSTLWSVDFTDAFFTAKLKEWLDTGRIRHDTSHVRDFDAGAVTAADRGVAAGIVREIKRKKVILGVFDEGCMGMYNAIIDDEMLNPMGMYKERLSQSALYAAMLQVQADEAKGVYDWLKAKGMTFHTGSDDATELTDAQIIEQCKMYIAAVRIANTFGCDAVGIQYQQGLKDLTPASDLVEGVLNNRDRPPVYPTSAGASAGETELFAGQPLPHFNEVDEGSAVDAVVTNRVWSALSLDPATTLHDLRWGERWTDDRTGTPNGFDEFVWVFEISGAVPPSHFARGYADAHGYRQPRMYFPKGGSSVQGTSKPGEIVWSRVFVMAGVLHADVGRATVVTLPAAEVQRRLDATTPQWPIMSAVLHGVSRDQMMARHKANHIQVAYATDAATADRALAIKAQVFAQLGIRVHICGKVNL